MRLGPEGSGHRLTDEDHGRGFRPVSTADVAPAHEPGAHRPKQLGGAGLQREPPEASHGVDPLDEQALGPGVPEGDRQSSRRLDHTWYATGLRLQPAHQLGALLLGQPHAPVLRARIEHLLQVVAEPQ